MGKQVFSQQEFRKYLRLYPDADCIEIAEVRDWMVKGYSPYANGDGICDDKGKMMDFIAAMRFEEKMYQQHRENPELFRKSITPVKNIGAPDLPF